MDVQFDFSNCMLDRVGAEHGLSWSEIDEALRRLGPVHRALAEHRDPEREWPSDEQYHTWRNLPFDRDTLREVQRWARGVRRKFDAVLVLGIGGSALGTIALRSALLHPFHNERKRSARKGPRLYVVDNIDPALLAGALDVLDPAKTLVSVVTKSGDTVETMAQYMVVREWLRAKVGGAYKEHLVFTTRPDGGALRRIAEEEGIRAFDVLRGVGGRFSVLSPVGLVPAALVGIDTRALLAGAAAMDKRCKQRDLRKNPAALFAAVHYLLDTRHGKPIHVMMPYADALKNIADWFCQLWAESLGKAVHLDGSPAHVGQTPVKAVGATDQHSQVQLYTEGPFDKVVTFLSAGAIRPDLTTPDIHGDHPDLAYLRGKALGEILRLEERATRLALRDAGRPTCTLSLPEIHAHTVGQLLQLLEVATAYAGGLYEVNAFDQPGVEQGKRYTYGGLGREGYAAYADKLAAAQAANPECVV